MKHIIFIATLLVGVFALSSCTETQENSNTNNNSIKADITEQELTIEDKKSDDMVAEVKEFEMESFTEVIDGKYHPQFSLKEIKVKKGDTVRLKINTTKGTHDFKIDELDVYSETPTGEVTTIEFVASKAGDFVYWCTKPNHRKNGHWGTLIVEE